MFWVQQKLGAQKIGVTARNAPPWLRPVARRTLINDQSFVLKAKCGFQEINCRLEVWSIDYITMIIMRRWLFPFSGFWILNWVISTRGAARIFLRGGAEVMEAKALKKKNCLWLE